MPNLHTYKYPSPYPSGEIIGAKKQSKAKHTKQIHIENSSL